MIMAAARLNAAQNSILSFVRSAVSQGISGNETLRQLQAAGAGIRRTDFLDVYRYASGTAKAGFEISHVRKDYFPTLSTMPESRTDIRRDYSYNVRLDLQRADTGERFTKNITVTTDKLLRIREIEAEARDAFYDPDSGREGTEVDILDTVIIESRRKAVQYGGPE